MKKSINSFFERLATYSPNWFYYKIRSGKDSGLKRNWVGTSYQKLCWWIGDKFK